MEVAALQQRGVGETAPHLVEQVPVFTERPQLADDVADGVNALDVEQETGGSLGDGQHALCGPRPDRLLAEAEQPGGDNGPDGPLFGERSIRYRQKLRPALIAVGEGLSNLLDGFDAFEQAADALLLDSDGHGSPSRPTY